MKRKKSQTLSIPGAVGSLEIRLTETDSSDLAKPAGLVVISHPHPEFGGTMDNKVVTTIERSFQGLGYSTLAYNFRGVGGSEGVYDGGVGEQKDLACVVSWAQDKLTFGELVLSGFSFGAYVTLSAQPCLNANRLLIVAPPVGLYDFSGIEEVSVPWEVVIGLQDEVVEPREMIDWVVSRERQPTLYCRAESSHFFHGQLVWLKKLISFAY